MRRVVLLLILVVVPVFAGCSPRTATTPDASPTSKPAESTTGMAESGDHAARGQADPGMRDQRTKWIGNVPYDVFFDRPLQTYQQSGDAAAPGVSVAAAPSNAADPAGSAPPTGPSEGAGDAPASQSKASEGDAPSIDWGAVVPIALLEAESKAIRTRLSASLQTVATFNANTDAIATDGSVLALVAAIIERHPDSVNWKDRAPFVRQLAHEVSSNATGKGRGPLQKTREPFEKLTGILDGGTAPDMEAMPFVPLGDIGDRSQVMLRFETGFNWLRSDVNTASRLKEEKDTVLRETAVLGALATALGDPSFDLADQEAYRALLKQFSDGQQAMKQAAESNDFPGFERARDSVQKSCDACHLEYRNSSGDDQ